MSMTNENKLKLAFQRAKKSGGVVLQKGEFITDVSRKSAKEYKRQGWKEVAPEPVEVKKPAAKKTTKTSN